MTEPIKKYYAERYNGIKYFKMPNGKVEPFFWQDLLLFQVLSEVKLKEENKQ